jgi:putative membrane protein insertion efficiency factor
MKYLLMGFVRLWRAVISPLYGDVCKYYPTCSAYGLEALRLHGAIKGSYLTITRLARCHPWAKGGFDPVPGSKLEAELRAQGLQLYCDQGDHIHLESVDRTDRGVRVQPDAFPEMAGAGRDELEVN